MALASCSFPHPHMGRPRYAHTSVHPAMLMLGADRGQDIFWRVTFVPVLITFCFTDGLSQRTVFFIDNSAAGHALVKGVSGDPAANSFIELFRRAAAEDALTPRWIVRLPSVSPQILQQRGLSLRTGAKWVAVASSFFFRYRYS